MFESCRAHSGRRSAHFAGMRTFDRSTSLRKLGGRRRAKPACAALREGGLDRRRDVVRSLELRIVADVFEGDHAEIGNSLAGTVGDVGA